MRLEVVIFVFLSLATLAAFSLPITSVSLDIVKLGNGEECEVKEGAERKCCRNTAVEGVKYCHVCTEDAHTGEYNCGDEWTIDVKTSETGDSKQLNHAKDLIDRGVTILNEGSKEGAVVDSNVRNNAKDLFQQGLSIIYEEESDGEVDSNVSNNGDISKSANILINNVLNTENKKFTTEDGLNENSAVMIDRNTVNKNSGITNQVTPDFSTNDKLPLDGNVGVFNGDVGDVANPDETVDTIPYKCDAKLCKSTGVVDTAKLVRDMDTVCNGPLTCTDATVSPSGKILSPGGCSCTPK